jgi:PAS domain S-box-containing protein
MSTYPDLAAENQELRARLAEAEETIEAIRSGAVDALVTAGPAGDQVFTLQSAETPYRLLMESMNEGAATLAPDGTVLYCNNRFAEMAGRPAAQVVGSCVCECLLPEQQPAMRELIAQARSAGSKAEFTFSCTARPAIPVLLSLGPIALDSEAIGVVATDLSERKQYEAKLHQLNQELEESVRHRTAELQAVFDTAPIGLAIALDPEGRSIRGNPAMERTFGLGRGAELSRSAPQPPPYRCLQDGRELAPEQLPMQRAARGETITGYLLDIVRPDGATLTLHCNVVPLLDDQGQPRGAIGAFLDITDRKLAEGSDGRNYDVYDFPFRDVDGTPVMFPE